jgi:hypothetical protein
MQPTEYHSFAQALCDPALPPPSALRVAEGVDVAQRFAVYRNNVHVSLIDALADRFAVTQALVGEEFFRAMAREFVFGHKPADPVLAAYGDDIPEFIESHEPAATLPFLADVARLERDWSRAWAAADETALDRRGLASISAPQLAAARIRPHPAAYLIRSPWPVADLWQAHQQREPDLSSIKWQPQNVLITRPELEIRLQQLETGVSVVALALLQGESITQAAARTEGIDIGAALALFIDCGMIAEVLPA